MAARGVTPETADVFLHPSLERDWVDPLRIPGLGDVADRVQAALAAHEVIAVFGDFDVDGMSSTCLLTLALRRLGGDVHPFIPHRFGEGYGLSHEALQRVVDGCHPDLVITVDTGIASAHEVELALAAGIDVVVTDHHEPADLVPTQVPVADPKISPDNPSHDLAGAGVALKLVCELGRRLGQPDLWRSYTDVASLGTVSDMMLLQGENRALVDDGIRLMRHTSRPGLVALAAVAGCDLATIEADTLPFSLVPRLNAAGRMGDVEVAFDLLLTDDMAEATRLAARLETINNDRREIESTLSTEALARVEATYEGGRCIVVGGEGWHEGVKGIVASRIVNRYHVPTILMSISDGVAHGSGRSVGSVDLFHAVEQCSDLLVRFGGHAGAVGVTVDAANIDAFRSRLEEVLSALPAEQFEDKGEVSAVVRLEEIDLATIDSLSVLRPFGQGNKVPLLAATGVSMLGRARVGATGDHLRFAATDGVASIPAIMFRAPDVERAVEWDGACDLVFEAVNETWQGRTKPKLMVRDIIYRTPDEKDAPSKPLVDDLFARAPQILSRDEYSSIAEATSFFTKAVGVTFDGRQDVVRTLSVGDGLTVERVHDNPVDPNAIALRAPSGEQVGFLRRQIAAALAPVIDSGATYVARVEQLTGEEDRSLGVNVRVDRLHEPGSADAEHEDACTACRSHLAALTGAELDDALRVRLIGDHAFLPAQKAALAHLAAGESCLTVMATGRGKSLVFHLHAARMALSQGRASIFVYPLRALVADQSFHLAETFSELGMQVSTLTGETSAEGRDEVFSGLGAGSVDVVLTTPEFLSIHSDRFAASGRVGFVVVDEAHHAGLSKGGNRGSYQDMPRVLAELGGPVVLATTATAATPVAREVCRLLGTSSVVVDDSCRTNLSIDDHRELRDREPALVSLVATGEKCVIYVNSREQSVSLARMLRHKVPDLGMRIAFYNAGLSREERTSVEGAFRSGELSCIVSTSAFGEGVNLPDIRHVVLYHMPFGDVEFNQMSGRAGRDGNPAVVHLLFGSRDAHINERIIDGGAPDRSDLVILYRALQTVWQRGVVETGERSFARSNADIAQACLELDRSSRLDERSVSCGIAVFRELGFLETSGYGTARRIRMVDTPEHMELGRSIRYLEGMRMREDFGGFRDWVLTATADELLARINRPIVPDFGERVDGEVS
jgi:single-stranded-DNA-specific exonuclease